MTDDAASTVTADSTLRMASDIVAAYLSHNALQASQIPELIQTVYQSLAEMKAPAGGAPTVPQKPAVSIRKSVHPDYIICLEDGRKLKMLKRHLRTTYNLTPEEYRVKWGLPADYPMVAPKYAEQRSAFAKKIGLGRKRTTTRRGRKSK